MKKLITCLILALTLISTSAFAGYTAKDFLAETSSSSRTVYSAALVTGIYVGYMRSAKLIPIKKEHVDACIAYTQSIEAKYKNYDAMVASMLVYYLIADGELADSNVSELVSMTMLDEEICYGKKDDTPL